jgi:murein DD-endopeptidase MepM/ murein hydrolase activator NlpD
MRLRITTSVLLVSILFFLIPIGSIFAATADDVQQQINTTNSQIQALDREIKQYQDQIAETGEQKLSLAGLIKELTISRNKLIAEQKQTQKKITATGYVITAINRDIQSEQSSLTKSKRSLAKMLSDLNQKDNTLFIEKLVSQGTIGDASKEYNSIIDINEQVRAHIKDVQTQVVQLAVSKNKKVTEQATLNTLKKSLSLKEKAVLVAKQEKDTLLSETKNKESNYKTLLADRQKKRDAFEKDLENYEAQLKFILNPNLLPPESGGILSWPLDNVFVTQLFGRTVSAKRLYTSGSHSGVDFRASIGTSVKSMGTGVVVGVGDTDVYCRGASFGKWVFIKYNNGLSSTFGHLSYISAVVGQKVVAGDVVALSGNSGHSTGPHLHVTVYASQGADVKTVPSLSCSGKTFIMPIAPTNAYLDPMLYLPKIAASKIKNTAVRD